MTTLVSGQWLFGSAISLVNRTRAVCVKLIDGTTQNCAADFTLLNDSSVSRTEAFIRRFAPYRLSKALFGTEIAHDFSADLNYQLTCLCNASKIAESYPVMFGRYYAAAPPDAEQFTVWGMALFVVACAIAMKVIFFTAMASRCFPNWAYLIPRWLKTSIISVAMVELAYAVTMAYFIHEEIELRRSNQSDTEQPVTDRREHPYADFPKFMLVIGAAAHMCAVFVAVSGWFFWFRDITCERGDAMRDRVLPERDYQRGVVLPMYWLTIFLLPVGLLFALIAQFALDSDRDLTTVQVGYSAIVVLIAMRIFDNILYQHGEVMVQRFRKKLNDELEYIAWFQSRMNRLRGVRWVLLAIESMCVILYVLLITHLLYRYNYHGNIARDDDYQTDRALGAFLASDRTRLICDALIRIFDVAMLVCVLAIFRSDNLEIITLVTRATLIEAEMDRQKEIARKKEKQMRLLATIIEENERDLSSERQASAPPPALPFGAPQDVISEHSSDDFLFPDELERERLKRFNRSHRGQFYAALFKSYQFTLDLAKGALPFYNRPLDSSRHESNAALARAWAKRLTPFVGEWRAMHPERGPSAMPTFDELLAMVVDRQLRASEARARAGDPEYSGVYVIHEKYRRKVARRARELSLKMLESKSTKYQSEIEEALSQWRTLALNDPLRHELTEALMKQIETKQVIDDEIERRGAKIEERKRRKQLAEMQSVREQVAQRSQETRIRGSDIVGNNDEDRRHVFV